MGIMELLVYIFGGIAIIASFVTIALSERKRDIISATIILIFGIVLICAENSLS